jgi:RNA polymerase sigma-70 factor (ECF subfamily)
LNQNENAFEELSPERVLLGKEKVVALKNALNELPERTRNVFLLHRFEEFKYREIAQQLGISMSSVEKHMMDAIKHLAHRLGPPE